MFSYRVLVALSMACLLGCQAQPQQEKEKMPAPSSHVLAFSTGDLANGTLNGLDVAEDGSIVLRRKNLLRNASFEWDDYESRGIRDGLAADWGLWGKGYGQYSDNSVPYLPYEAAHSTRSQRIEFTAQGKEPLLLLQAVRGLKPNSPYTFSVDVKVDDPQQVEVALLMQFYGAEKYLISKQGEAIAPTKFTRLSLSAVTPEGTDQIRTVVKLTPKKENARATLWVDAAQLEEADKPTPFCAGYESGPAEYISPPIDLSALGDVYKFSWIACQPSSTDIQFQIRSASTETELAAAPWCGPPDAQAYSTRIETGENLIADPSLETDPDADGQPGSARQLGYGKNDRKCTVVSDAHEGKTALKVEITNYEDGDGRWHVATSGPILPDTEYAFSVWHKEDSTSTPIRLFVTLEDSKGEMHWAKGGSEAREASTAWRRDTLYFRTPKEMEIKRLWVQISLCGKGWIISDEYSVRRVIGSEEWPVNPVHRGARWLQYRAIMKTYDSYYTPKLYRTELRCGAPVPEIRWLNVLAADGQSQKYSFNPGQTAVFKPQVVDYSGRANIKRVELILKDPTGAVALRTKLEPAEQVSDIESFFAGSWRFPPNAPLGEWQAVVTACNKFDGSCSEMAVLKVRQPYKTAPQRMLVGALASDYGFSRYKGEALQKLIETYRSCKGLELWKLGVAWKRLEPTPGKFDEEVIDGLKTFISAAHAAGSKAQITIQQQNFPDWANNADWDNWNRYRYEQTKRLTDTWARLAHRLKDCAGLESYLLINEENHVYDADVYLRAMNKVASAVRCADPNLAHRITVRPNTRDPYLRTRIATDGSQDYDYGSGGYPTSAAWYFKKYASPLSQTSCLRMARFHESPIVFGGPGGIGEIGFFHRRPNDTFGDEEKLAGFQRAMQIAYELGADEFMLWEGTFSFDKREEFYPRLLAFRDQLIKRPRPSVFDVCLLLDVKEPLYLEPSPHASELDMTKQTFAAAIRFLDEKGYVWYYTSPEAMAIQSVQPKSVVRLSELSGKTPTEQERFLAEKLRDVKPSGTPLPWPK